MKSLDRFIQSWRIRKVRPYVQPGSRVLDIGASDGALFRQIQGIADYVGIEPELSTPVQIAPKATLLKGLFPAALEDTRPFDLIVLLAVLEHVPPAEQETLARACGEYLKPGGFLVVTVPSPATDYVLSLLRLCRLIDGMSLEQHYGFKPAHTPKIFAPFGLTLIKASTFQLGLNNLFVFQKQTTQSDFKQ
jgi:2-polyprenyl-3-methyl-5-hydroxy-6-metoxy-1,4-benzoquinol methylase